MSLKSELREWVESLIEAEPLPGAISDQDYAKIKEVGHKTAKEVHGDSYDKKKADKVINSILAKGRAKGMSGKDIAGMVQSTFRNVEEGILRGVGSTLLTPARVAASGVKTVGRTVKGGIGAAGKTLKAAGQLVTLKPKKALSTLGQAGKSAVSPVTGAAKDVSKMVTKPVKALRKGGVVY